MATGTVKWFDDAKDSGSSSARTGDVFVHYSAIVGEGYRPSPRAQVEFDVEEDRGAAGGQRSSPSSLRLRPFDVW